MQIEQRAVSALIPYSNNSRTHSAQQIKQIAASIKEFGFTNPVLIDEHGGIIAGHGRIQAAELLGIDTVPTITLGNLTKAQIKAYVIADNQLALNAGWNLDLLAVEIEQLVESEFNIGLLGFDDDFVDKLLGKSKPGLTDDDDAPALDANTVTKKGDLWFLDNHRLLCGDSTSIDDIQKLTGGIKVDMWLTDPLYNVNYEGKTSDSLKIQNDKMTDESFRLFLRDAFVTADTVMKPGAVFYIWHADSEGFNFRAACMDAGWKVRQCLIWNKSTMVMGRQDYQWKHEPCLYGWKEGAGHLWASDRKQTTIINFDKPARNGEHPTMKPVGLFEYQMLNNTKGGDIVLDSFGGSGTTLIAAEKNGRLAYLMELDEKYCDVIVKRWQDFTGKIARNQDGISFDELKA